jgi:hypothetical protein
MHFSIVPVLDRFKHTVSDTNITLELDGGNILMQLERVVNEEIVRQFNQEHNMEAQSTKPEDLFYVDDTGNIQIR